VLDDEWTLYEGFFPEGGGRTRMSVQSVDDKYLLVIGGDATCTGGLCPPDRALTTVDLIDIRSGNRLISSTEHAIPQLNAPRQTPATALSKSSDHDQEDRYVLHVVAGRTIAEDGGTDVLTTTEVLSFDRIKVPPRTDGPIIADIVLDEISFLRAGDTESFARERMAAFERARAGPDPKRS
jgi:hypothetical protein